MDCEHNPRNWVGGLSEKPVQEKLPVSTSGDIVHEKSVAPVGEAWADRWDEKIKSYDKDGGFIVYVEGYENTDFDVDLMKSYISKLLQDEREKAHDGGLGVRMVEYTEAFDKGAGAERQRIEEAVGKLRRGEPRNSYTGGIDDAIDAVLKIIHKEGEQI